MTSVNARTVTIVFLSMLSMLKTEIIDRKPSKYGYLNHVPDTSVNKVSFTQKGYIQFLKYIADVPIITDFTYCVWLKSSNLTHSHPLLSYSRHETERLIRGWITPGGKNLNLEILEKEIFSIPVNFVEDQWYHICQSWASSTGTWIGFINGNPKSGINTKMRSIKIPRGGDIVVGQEYTDFDKGLDDGIEGDIYGFNLLLAAASPSTAKPDKQTPVHFHRNDLIQRRQLHLPPTPPNPTFHRIPSMNIHTTEAPQFDNYDYGLNYEMSSATSSGTGGEIYEIKTGDTDVPGVLSYFTTGTNRDGRGFLELGRSVMNMFDMFNEKLPVRKTNLPDKPRLDSNYYASKHLQYHPDIYNKHYSNRRVLNGNSKILNEIGSYVKPLGLVLVELSYNKCALGKGSPIYDKRLLISWTKTPVRVFGGAILKNIMPFCKRSTYSSR